jgi:hypothetical protein
VEFLTSFTVDGITHMLRAPIQRKGSSRCVGPPGSHERSAGDELGERLLRLGACDDMMLTVLGGLAEFERDLELYSRRTPDAGRQLRPFEQHNQQRLEPTGAEPVVRPALISAALARPGWPQ